MSGLWQVGSKVQKCISESWIHRKHMLGIPILSGHKSIFHSSPCWIDIRVKHQVPCLAWTFIHAAFCSAHHRFLYLLGHHRSNERGDLFHMSGHTFTPYRTKLHYFTLNSTISINRKFFISLICLN